MDKIDIKLVNKRNITKIIPNAYGKALKLVVKYNDDCPGEMCEECSGAPFVLMSEVFDSYPNKRVVIKLCPHAYNNVESMYIKIKKADN